MVLIFEIILLYFIEITTTTNSATKFWSWTLFHIPFTQEQLLHKDFFWSEINQRCITRYAIKTFWGKRTQRNTLSFYRNLDTNNIAMILRCPQRITSNIWYKFACQLSYSKFRIMPWKEILPNGIETRLLHITRTQSFSSSFLFAASSSLKFEPKILQPKP